MILSKREVNLIIVLLFLVSGGAYYNFYYMPKTAQITTLRNSVAEKQTEIDEAVFRVMQYGALRIRRSNALEVWDDTIRFVPSYFDDADILMRLQNVIRTHTNNISLRFTDGYEKMEYTLINTVDIGFTVTYDQLQAILRNFSNQLIANRIIDLSFTEVRVEGSEPMLNVTLQVEFITRK